MTPLFRLTLVFPLLILVACATAAPPAEQNGARLTDLARSGYVVSAEGVPGMATMMDPSITWHQAEGLPYGGVYRGPDAIMKNVFMRVGGDFEGFTATPREFITEGNQVVVLGEYRGTHRKTGRAFVAPFAHVWRFENGRWVEFRQFTDTGLWLAAMN